MLKKTTFSIFRLLSREIKSLKEALLFVYVGVSWATQNLGILFSLLW